MTEIQKDTFKTTETIIHLSPELYFFKRFSIKHNNLKWYYFEEQIQQGECNYLEGAQI